MTRRGPSRSPLGIALDIALLAVVYFATARLGYALGTTSGFATLVWIPSGVALAFMLSRGLRVCPGVFLGALVVNLGLGAPVGAALTIASGNTLEAVLAVMILRRSDFRSSLERLRDVVALAVVSAVAPIVSATFAIAALSLSELVAKGQGAATWMAWWAGDLGGIVLVTPLLAMQRNGAARRPLEGIALGAAVVGVGALVFLDFGASWVKPLPRPYFLFPLLIWAALRFGPRGAARTTFAISAIAIYGTAMKHGPLRRSEVNDSLLAVVTFLVISAVATLVLAAVSTERVADAAAARESEAQRRAVLDAALDAIVIMDGDGRVREFNSAAEVLFGRKSRDAVGQPVETLLVPVSLRPRFRRFVEELRTHDSTLLGRRSRFPAMHADGTEFPAEITVTEVHDVAEPHLFTAFVRDFTAQDRLEHALDESRDELEQRVLRRTAALREANEEITRSEQRLREAQSIAHVGSFEWDIATERVTVSPELRRMLRVDDATPIDLKSFIGYVEEGDRARVQSIVERIVRDAEPLAVETFESRLVRTDGAVRVFESNTRVEVDAARQPVRVIGTSHDVTDHRRGERARSRLAAIVESSGDAIIGKTLDGVIETWNESARQVYGYSSAEAVGQPTSFLVPPDHLLEVLRHIAEVGTLGKMTTFETLGRKKDGRIFEAAVTMSPTRDRGGRIVGISTITRDITERALTEKRLKHSLEEKEVLLREIHHRVKNNLQLVASLLRLQADTSASFEARHGFDESERRIMSMALVHQLLYQSKDLASVDFGEYLATLSTRLARAYGVGGRIVLDIRTPALRLDIDRAIPCALIVNELVSNALTHAFPYDKTGRVEIRIVPGLGDGFILTVHDDGVGIPSELRIDALRTLGLQVVRALAKQLNAVLDIRRVDGTTVTLTLA